MDKSYLIKFDEEGNRGYTYANSVHYLVIPEHEEYKVNQETGTDGYETVKETIQNLVDGFDYAKELEEGAIWVNDEQFDLLLGNTNGKIHIYKDGEFIEKPPYEPTAEELKQQKLEALELEYNEQNESFKDDLALATLSNNNDAIESLKEEYAEFQSAYEQAVTEVKEGE